LSKKAPAPASEGPGSDPLAELSAPELREVISAISDLLIVARSDGEARACGSGWQRVLGWTLEELRVRPFVELIHPDDRAARQVAVEAVCRGEGPYQMENRYLHRDGSYRWFHWTALWLPRQRCYCAFGHDITERKRVESERGRLAAIIGESPRLVGTVTPDGRVTYLNAAGRGLLGLAADAPIGELHIPDFHPEWALRLVMEQGIPDACRVGFWQGESAIRDSAGTEIPVDQLILAHRDSAGRLEYLSTLMHDARPRHLAIRQMQESEQRFRTLFDAAPNTIVIIDMAGRYIDVNSRFLEICGLAREQVVGRRPEEIPEVFHFETRAKDEEMQRRLLETGFIAGHEETVVRRSDGQRRTVLLTSRMIRLAGEPCFLSLAVDISELRQMERQMRQAQKMDAIGRLASGVAHDFNNLLTVIGGYTAQALAEVSADHPLRSGLIEVRNAAARAGQLTRQLLAFSRADTPEPVLVDLGAAVADAERMLARLIAPRIRIVTHLAVALPPVLADSGHIAQILINLIVNARDAMPGGGLIDITTSLAGLDESAARALGLPGGRYVCLRVADTGTGMDEETLGRIFEPFFTTKPVGQGTGLGLAIVYGIVKQCSGAIRVESRLGRGSCFEIFLPPAQRAVAPSLPSVEESELCGSATVLLVEDDDALRSLVSDILAGAGYRVLAAAGSTEALRLVAAHEAAIDLLLTDLVLPGLDGRSLARQLRGSRPALPIVFMSGYLPGAGLDPTIESECAEFIRKPFAPAALLRALKRAQAGRPGD
jgi:PAS domain S-box-containing protein